MDLDKWPNSKTVPEGFIHSDHGTMVIGGTVSYNLFFKFSGIFILLFQNCNNLIRNRVGQTGERATCKIRG